MPDEMTPKNLICDSFLMLHELGEFGNALRHHPRVITCPVYIFTTCLENNLS